MSGGYDNKIVRGPADLIEPGFAGNTIVQLVLTAATPQSFNLFGGTSFYLNQIAFEVALTGLSNASETITCQFMQGPNPGNLVGATDLLDVIVFSPQTAGTVPYPIAAPMPQFSNLGYRNRTGAPAYLHVNIQALVSGAVRFIAVGGSTSLM